jgi:hypothetical protein
MSESHAAAKGGIDPTLLLANSPPPSAAAMKAAARNHLVVATSKSCDTAQVARSVAELESGRFSGLVLEVDLWLHQRNMRLREERDAEGQKHE